MGSARKECPVGAASVARLGGLLHLCMRREDSGYCQQHLKEALEHVADHPRFLFTWLPSHLMKVPIPAHSVCNEACDSALPTSFLLRVF